MSNKQKFAEARQELKSFYGQASDLDFSAKGGTGRSAAERVLANRNILAFDVQQLTLQVFRTTHTSIGVARPSEFYAQNREAVSESILSALERAAEKS